jgi:hypothetical protein
MSGENVEKEKDCITRCQEEFLDCVEYNRSDCAVIFNDCTGACER